MKKSLLFTPFALLFLLFTSFNNVTPSGMNVTVKKGKFTINSVKMIPVWQLAACEKALGPEDRSKDGYNITHTYDDLSVVLFEPKVGEKGSGTISEIQFYITLPSDPASLAPTRAYKGKMKIGNLTVSAEMTPAQMRKGLKGWKETESYTDHNFRMAQNGLYVYFLFNDAETKLIKVSIGLDKRK
ncbi:MAG: hypothetical protein M3R17_18655 [Bacteroidota bacterium]|nr:hypothetical protein [Bacteroidota bacterium]